MKYRLKIINDVAFVTRDGFVNAMINVRTPRIFCGTRRVQVQCKNVTELAEAVHRLRGCYDLLCLKMDETREIDPDRTSITLQLDETQFSISTLDGDLDQLSDQLGQLSIDIGTQLRLGEAICNEPNSHRPGLGGQVEFYECDTENLGATVEEWTMARKRLAISRGIGKMTVGVTIANKRDPYGLCLDRKEFRREYFVLDRESAAWIAFRDLHPITEEVMRNMIKHGLTSPVQLDRSQVQLPLKRRTRDADGSNVIKFEYPRARAD
jgi:hypothetical protein